MRKLLVILCVSALMFGCSEEAEEMMDDGVKEPTVESLPDWDSLPPLEGEIKRADRCAPSRLGFVTPD